MARAGRGQVTPVGSLTLVSSSLYRKYRPEHFSELVGQDHVTVALRISTNGSNPKA